MATVAAQVNLLVGGTKQINATVLNAAGGVIGSPPPVTYLSSSTAVATVSGTGLITAVALGTAVVTVASGDAKAEITVNVVSDSATKPAQLSITLT
jgi:uncharacterized protein YjdB